MAAYLYDVDVCWKFFFIGKEKFAAVAAGAATQPTWSILSVGTRI